MDKEKIEYMICDKKHVRLSDTEECSDVCQYCENNNDLTTGNVCLFRMNDCEVYFCSEDCLIESWGKWYDLEKVDYLPEYASQYEELKD